MTICRRCRADLSVGLHGPGCCAPPPKRDDLCQHRTEGGFCRSPAVSWWATAGWLCRAHNAERAASSPWTKKPRRKR